MSATANVIGEPRPGNPHDAREAAVGSELAASGAAMDEDLLDVNCGRCGRPLVMRIEDLRDQHTVECADCARRVNDDGDAPTPTDESALPGLRLRPWAPQRREPR